MFNNRRRLISLAFVLVSLLTINFAIRGIQHGRRLRARPDEPIQGWMNIGYVAHSYHVPPQVIHEALGLPPQPDRRPLARIAVDTGRTTDEVIANVMTAIQQFRGARPPDPDAPAPPPVEPRTP
ncbi:MAG: hypothetical protein M3R24_16480 [Chloroflexota bacterium]|nr:hypothetical protein [Chloroflexota bacterium]PLS78892.1 MAG: hypothetical protein CYG59_16105 [Chloroflexota bacterium]